jgi:outer membrane protein assembly factor BamB
VDATNDEQRTLSFLSAWREDLMQERRAIGGRIGCLFGAAVILLVTLHSSFVATAGEAPYRLVENWPHVPVGKTLVTVTGVAVDRTGVVYAFRRDTGEIWRFDQEGNYLGVWGPSAQPGFVKMAHTIQIDRDGFFWITDKTGMTVRKYRGDGTLLMTLGQFGVAGEGPNTFNGPTSVQLLPNGDFIVSDGYYNSRLAWFDKNGKFLKQVGTFGRGPTQFVLAHAVVRNSRGRLFVADRCDGPVGPEDDKRRNPGCHDSRIEVLEQDGTYVASWPELSDILALEIVGDRLYAAENRGRIIVIDSETGKQLNVVDSASGGHQLAVDASGDVYVATLPGGVRRYTQKPK